MIAEELLEAPLVESLADSFHERIVEIEVMDNAETHSKHFASLEKVTNIGS